MTRATAQMRRTRANPPGKANDDRDRREVYAAALQQSEDLFDAAAAVDAFARPLPLYYAVSQAGRAIAAAWLDHGWRARGHGLTEDTDRDEWQRGGSLRFCVKPTSSGVFTAVAKSLGSNGLSGSVELGALWAALPLIQAPAEPARWMSALPLFPAADLNPPGFLRIRQEHHGVLIVPDGARRDPDSVNELLRGYPAAAGARVIVAQGIVAEQPTPFGMGIPVAWPKADPPAAAGPTPEYLATLVRNRIPQYRYRGEHWLIPAVSTGHDDLPPLLLWWVLVFGLSLLARYEPAAWRHALNPDEPGPAVLLEGLLDDALIDLPRLVAEALTHGQLLEPARY